MRKRRNKKPSESEVFAILVLAIFVGISMPNGFDAALASVASLLLLFVWAAYAYQRTRPQRSLQGFLTKFRPVKTIAAEEIDAMNGIEFERFVGELFRVQGNRIEYTSHSTDYGVDLVIEKDRIRTAVQIKRYKRPLSQAPVREVVAGMLMYRCSKAMVVTNSTFTKSAYHLAKSNYVKLVDREALLRLVAQVGYGTKLQADWQGSSGAIMRATIGELLRKAWEQTKTSMTGPPKP